jgi:putative salt-induced outer membrane protein YdiY
MLRGPFHVFMFLWSLFFLGLPNQAGADTFYFNNGDILSGNVIEERGSVLSIQSEVLGPLEIKREHIKEIRLDQVSAQTLTKERIQPEWVRELEGSFSRKRGNTANSELVGSFFINRKMEKVNEVTLKGRGYYSEQGRKMNSRKLYGMGRYAFSFGATSKWYQFTKLELDHDRFANIASRMVPALGVGYWFSAQMPFKALIEFAGGYERTDFRAYSEIAHEFVLVPRAYLETTFLDKVTASQEFVVYPSMTDFGVYRYHSESVVDVPISDQFLLRFAAIDDYQSAPGADAKRNDLRLQSSIAYRF